MSSKSTNKKHKTFNIHKVSNEDSKSSSAADGDDECGCEEEKITVFRSPGLDPRFQQQNQTSRCFVMYCDFHQCEYLLGEGAEACTWFKDVYRSICPNDWIERWDTQKDEKRMPWYHKEEFPKARYGKL